MSQLPYPLVRLLAPRSVVKGYKVPLLVPLYRVFNISWAQTPKGILLQ